MDSGVKLGLVARPRLWCSTRFKEDTTSSQGLGALPAVGEGKETFRTAVPRPVASRSLTYATCASLMFRYWKQRTARGLLFLTLEPSRPGQRCREGRHAVHSRPFADVDSDMNVPSQASNLAEGRSAEARVAGSQPGAPFSTLIPAWAPESWLLLEGVPTEPPGQFPWPVLGTGCT